MHGYYLHYHDINDPSRKRTGIDWKVADQITALNDAGCNCDFLFCPQPETIPTMVASCLPGFSDGIVWPNPQKLAQVDYLYIRRPRFASKQLINMLAQTKYLNPRCIVLYEVPTYPYDNEMNNVKMAFALSKDRKYRRALLRYVDRVVDLYGNTEVFGIPTLPAFNGINLARVKTRSPSKANELIRMVGAAFFCKWHGMDRLLEGLYQYYNQGGSRSIKLELAGEGDATPLLQKMTKRYGLDGIVTFHGVLNSMELDRLYDNATLGIASLGMHRIGLKTGSTIKTREYLAKGLPFLYAGDIDVFENRTLDYCFRIPSDETPVDIPSLLERHDALYNSVGEKTIIESMREYANATVSIEIAMHAVVDYLKSNCR